MPSNCHNHRGDHGKTTQAVSGQNEQVHSRLLFNPNNNQTAANTVDYFGDVNANRSRTRATQALTPIPTHFKQNPRAFRAASRRQNRNNSLNKSSDPLFNEFKKELMNNGSLKKIKPILNKFKSNLNISNEDGNTALMLAVIHDRKDVVEFLTAKCKNGADPNIKNKDGKTALMLAIESEKQDICNILINSEKINSDVQSNTGQSALMIAATNPCTDIVNILLDKGVNIEAKDNKGCTALIWATDHGRTDTVNLFIAKGANIEAKDNDGNTALMHASRGGKIDIINLLIDNGANIEAKNNGGFTALMAAIKPKNSENAKKDEDVDIAYVVNLLLDKGADINVQSNQHLSPLILAAYEGHPKTVKKLINYHADLNLYIKEEKLTALTLAIENGDEQIVDILINAEINLEIRDKEDHTALFRAILKGHINIIKKLLKAGANLNAANHAGWTPFMLASSENNTEIVKILLDQQLKNSNAQKDKSANLDAQSEQLIDLDQKTKEGCTALMIASEKGHLKVVDMLIDAGVNLNVQNLFGETALFRAVFNGQINIIKKLLEAGANVNATNHTGWTPLMLASSENKKEIVKILLNERLKNSNRQKGKSVNIEAQPEHSIDLDQKNNEGYTALMIASLNGHLDVLVMLKKAGANLNLQDKDGYTALLTAIEKKHNKITDILLNALGINLDKRTNQQHTALIMAAIKGNINAVKNMLTHNIDVNAEDDRGRTARDWAYLYGHKEICDLLKDRGAYPVNSLFLPRLTCLWYKITLIGHFV